MKALNGLDGTNGFRVIDARDGLVGTPAFSARASLSFSAIGDFNGDGIDDYVVGSPGSSVNGANNAGEAYVVYGDASGFPEVVDFGQLNGANGFRVFTGLVGGRLGGSVAGIGDVNGDGLDDVAITGRNAGGTGGAFVLLGTSTTLGASRDLTELSSADGYFVSVLGAGDGVFNSELVSKLGDVNGDGVDDFGITGFLLQSESPSTANGGAFVIYGTDVERSGDVDALSLEADEGFRILGLDAQANAAPQFDALGDVDGDGRDDIIIAGRSVLAEQGVFDDRIGYLLYGTDGARGATVDVLTFGDVLGTDPDGVPDGGSIIRSEVENINFFGSGGFTAVGDVNGDSLGDFFVATSNGLLNAKGYVVYGSATGLPADIRLGQIDGSNGFVIPEFDVDTGDGAFVAGVEDINADGFDDIALGQPSFNTDDGRVLFLLGSDSSAAELDLKTVSFQSAAQLTGTVDDRWLGALVEAAGDVNGDGFDDVFVSDTSGTIGASGIIFGRAEIGGNNVAPVASDDSVVVSTMNPATTRFNLFSDNGNGADQDANLDALSVFAAATDLVSLPDIPDTVVPLAVGQTLPGVLTDIVFPSGLTLRIDRTGDVIADMSGLAFGEAVEESFVYRVWDGRNGFDTATVSVSAVNNTFDLESISAGDGFFATARFDQGVSGRATPLGDVNGDGVADFALVDPNERVDGVFGAGRVFVAFGSDSLPTAPAREFSSSPLLETLDLAGRFDGITGFTISGAERGNTGLSLAGAGDVNGDGVDDIIVGTPNLSSDGLSFNGAAFVVFGGQPSAADLSLGALDQSTGFRLTGAEDRDRAGTQVAAAGDVNGDGYDDILVSSRGVETVDPVTGETTANVGAVDVVFGGPNGPGISDLGALDGSNGFRIVGAEEQEGFGDASLSRAGDMNGDGFDDFIVVGNQKIHIVYGSGAQASAVRTTADLGSSASVLTIGDDGSELDDARVAAAGDVNGDGLDDVVIGAPFTRIFDENGERPLSFVLFGAANPDAEIDLLSLNGANGFAVAGLVGSGLGDWVDGGGDLNNDGVSDIILGAPSARSQDGQTVVLFGSADPFPSILDVRELGPDDGLALNGVNRSGRTVAFGGDINGDGADDVLIGQGSGTGIYAFYGDSDGSGGSDGGNGGSDGGNGGAQTPPSLTDDILALDLANGASQSINLLQNDTDAEDDALQVIAIDGDGSAIGSDNLLGSGAILRVDGDGTATLAALAPLFRALPDGAMTTDTVTYTVEDARGAASVGTVSLSVEGTNDAPETNGALSVTVTESDAPFVLNLLDGASDPDTGDTISVQNAVLTGDAFGVRLDGDTLRVTPSVYLTLNEGEQADITVDFDVVDQSGATTARRATVTIEGEAGSPPMIDPPPIPDKDDPEAANVFIFGSNSITEGTGFSLDAAQEVRLSRPLRSDVVVNVQVTGDTRSGAAAQSEDVVGGLPSTMTVTIPAGQTRASLPLSIVGDMIDEDDEALSIIVVSAVAPNDPALTLHLPPSATPLTIVDDDSEAIDVQEATLNVIAPPDGPEGDSGASVRSFTIELSRQLGVDVAVDVVLEGIAAPNSADALDIVGGLPQTQTLLIPAGSTQATFDAAIAGDTIREFNDGLSLRVSNVDVGDADGIDASVTVATGAATTVIENDDTVSVRISTPNRIVTEGDAINPQDAVFFVERTGDLSGFTEVTYDISEIVGPPRLVPLERFNPTNQRFEVVGFKTVEGGSVFTPPTGPTETVTRFDTVFVESQTSLIDDLAMDQGIEVPDFGGTQILFQDEVSGARPVDVAGVLKSNFDVGFEYGLALDVEEGDQGYGSVRFFGFADYGIVTPRNAVEGETISVTVNNVSDRGINFSANALSIEEVSLNLLASVTRESGLGDITITEPITGTLLETFEGFTIGQTPAEFLEIVSVDEEGLSVDVPKLPVGVELKASLPNTEAVRSTAGGLNDTIASKSLSELATVNASLVELASFIPTLAPLKALSADLDRKATVGGVDVKAKLAYTILDIPIGLGVGLVQRVTYTPNPSQVRVTLDGQEQTGLLGEPLSFTVGQANRSYDGTAELQLSGVLDVQYSIEPLGKIGYEVFSGKVDLSVGSQEILKEEKIGPLFEDETNGSIDFPVFEFDPIRLELQSDFFEAEDAFFVIPALKSDEPDLGGKVVFGPGETIKEIRLPIVPDDALEANITVRAEIQDAVQSDGSAVQISAALANLLVVDDDDDRPESRSLDFGSGFADPHLTTLDGLNYSFQAVGEFVLLESVGSPDAEAVSIQIRTAPVGNSDLVSSIAAVALNMGGVRATVDVFDPVPLRLDGVETALDTGETVFFDGGALFFDGSAYSFANDLGELVRIDLRSDFLDVSLQLLDDRAGAVRGLLGDADGDPNDDLQDETGSVFVQPTPFAQLYGAFADAWRVTDANSLFDYAIGFGTADYTDLSFPRASVSLSDLPADLIETATAIVDAAGVLDPAARDDAILDVALTGRAEFAAGAAALRQSTASELQVTGTPELTAAIGVRANATTLPEGNAGDTTPVSFTVYRLGDLSSSASVLYSIQTDANLSDQTLREGRVSFAAGEATKTVTVDLIGNDVASGATEIRIDLAKDADAETPVLIAGPSAVTRVENDDGVIPASVSVSAVEATTLEGNPGDVTVARFVIERDGDIGSAASATVHLVASDTDAGDFVQTLDPFQVNFSAGVASRIVEIEISADDLIEPDETFRLEVILGAATAFADVTILNDDVLAIDAPPSEIVLADNDVDENALNNTLIGALALIGANPIDEFSFELLDDADGRFAIGRDILFVADGTELDFETETEHSIVVRATNIESDLSVDQTLTIQVNDLFEQTADNTGGDQVSLGNGPNTLRGSLESFFGDTIDGFGSDDEIVFDGAQIKRTDISVSPGSAILAIDSDGDGLANGQFTLTGDFLGGEFMAVIVGNDTYVTYETYLPELSDGRAVNADLVNGINNQRFLTGDGVSDFQVTLRDIGFAGYNNVLGVYEIDGSGGVVDARLLFKNVNTDKSASASILDVEVGHQLGFFVVQDAATWAAALRQSDALTFINSSGQAGNISDGRALSLAVNGVAVDEIVFHSFNADLNIDGLDHALSGVDVGGETITVGFEDLIGGGDRDFEDVVFRVEVFDGGLLI